jgi:F420-dependent oxidoreductase-like protein
MTQIGIMIEGQDGLNWDRWKRLLQAAEDFGYQCVFRSDHFTNPNEPDKDSLDLFVALTYAATATQRVEFGSLVAPTTFRHPSITARMAAQIDDLSGGRLVIGLGAGWNEREHRVWGIPFYDKRTRHEMLEDALEITHRVFQSDDPVTYQGKHFSLEGATLLPRPQRPGGPILLVGGNGPTRTLPLAAKYAQEWNGVYLTPDQFRERNTLLDDLMRQHGRDPQSIRRSLMHGCYLFRTEAEMAAWMSESGTSADRMKERGVIHGTTDMIADQIAAFVEAGVERFMLQWLDQDDLDGLELIAKDVLPKFHTAAV